MVDAALVQSIVPMREKDVALDQEVLKSPGRRRLDRPDGRGSDGIGGWQRPRPETRAGVEDRRRIDGPRLYARAPGTFAHGGTAGETGDRASWTAIELAASRLKNHTPGSRSPRRT